VIAGGPELGSGPMAERARRFGEEFDFFRSAVVNEPRGSDAVVGALLCDPAESASTAGVIFFNNVGLLGMCGHGSIGLAVTLHWLGRIAPGAHRLETPAGAVGVVLHDAERVTVHNVASFRHAQSVSVDVPNYGRVVGDVAWGGNWFFLVREHRYAAAERLELDRLETLTEFTWAIRRALAREGITGAEGAEIDHVELFGPASRGDLDSRNFVLCPGKAYDRSPCGTGTSAKMACLYADGELGPGEFWRQESIVGSVFEGSIEPLPSGSVLPSITGTAYVTAEAQLILNESDPFRCGISAQTASAARAPSAHEARARRGAPALDPVP
jgi:4-hydroxyproline epimerase